jgi:hypothetical protein
MEGTYAMALRGRALRAGLAAGLLAVALATPALAGGKPEHVRTGAPDPFVFEAGLSCPFAVEWAFEVNNLTVTTFPVQANGDQLVRQTGHVMATVTNLENDRSITTNPSDRQDFLYHADGTMDVRINGRALAAYFPGDVGGPAMYLFIGHLDDTVTASDFTVLRHSFSGTSVDLCAALS